MWAHKNQIINLFVFFMITLFLCSFQASLWGSLLSSNVAPHLWLNVMLFIVLFRAPLNAMMVNYGLVLVIHAYSLSPLGIMFSTVALLTLITAYVRKRLFWPNTRYFIIASFFFSLSYHVIYVILSHLLETNPVSLQLLNRIFEILLTVFTSAPTYWLLHWIDRLTDQTVLAEAQGDHE